MMHVLSESTSYPSRDSSFKFGRLCLRLSVVTVRWSPSQGPRLGCSRGGGDPAPPPQPAAARAAA
jgi:hypothetical protein